MTANERLAEIKARAEAATRGPWEWGQGDLCHLGGFVAGPPIHYEAVWANRASDAEFIAASRTDVPALVAALEAVLELHDMAWECEDPYGHVVTSCPGCAPLCTACQYHYPCPTVETVTEALGADQ